MTESRPNVYEYTAHGAFIGDTVRWMSREHTFMSLRWLAKRLEMSHGTLSKITSGKRSLSEDHAADLARHLRLGPGEAEYFLLLVAKDSAATEAARAQLERAVTGRQRVETADRLDENHSQVMDNWLAPTLRELLVLMPDATPDQLARRLQPEVTVDEVRNALALLDAAGLLADSTASTGHEPTVGANYHRQMIELGSRSIRDVPWQERAINGFTASVSEGGFREMQKQVRELVEVMFDLCEKDTDSDRVIQLNLQLFPLSSAESDSDM